MQVDTPRQHTGYQHTGWRHKGCQHTGWRHKGSERVLFLGTSRLAMG